MHIQKYSVSCAKGVFLAPLNSACSVLLGPAKLCMQTYKKCVDLESIGRVVYTGSLPKTAAVDMLSCHLMLKALDPDVLQICCCWGHQSCCCHCCCFRYHCHHQNNQHHDPKLSVFLSLHTHVNIHNRSHDTNTT